MMCLVYYCRNNVLLCCVLEDFDENKASGLGMSSGCATASKLQTLLLCRQDRFELAQKKKEEQERQKKAEADETARRNRLDIIALFGRNVFDDDGEDSLDTSYLDTFSVNAMKKR
jgi:hypothetical protein